MSLFDQIDLNRVPQHVAIIMDGNGRWAKNRAFHRTLGHARGASRVKEIIREADRLGIKALTLYAFSTENWKRSPDEVRFLMGYNVEVLRRRRDQLNAWGVRVRWAGRRPKLWSSVIRELEAAEALTAKNKTLTLTMCVNYGSRVEMLDAINAMSADVASGVLKPGSVTEKTLSKYLNSGFLPDVDLFIRSSGEQRISNFLLWQSAYAELVFDDTPWPDFDRKSLWNAILAFTNRDRRFGGAVDKPAK
jgi:undecaprenyl diphosphate synthase